MNPFEWTSAIVAAIVVFTCAVTLVFSRDYHSGIVGTLSLSMLGVAAFARVWRLWEHGLHSWTSTISVLVWTGLALFLLRMTVRFFHRRRRKDASWYWS